MKTASLFNAAEIPSHLLARSRTWFESQMARLEKLHGRQWEDHKEWIASYLNAELKDLVKKHE